MIRIAIIRGLACICSVIALPFLLLYKLLSVIVSQLSKWCGKGNEQREEEQITSKGLKRVYRIIITILRKSYWKIHHVGRYIYWEIYFSTSRKLYKNLCKNAYINLFFVFLQKYVKRSKGRLRSVRVWGVKEYVDRHGQNTFYQVVEAGKIRQVCSPEYFEGEKEKIEKFQSPDIYLAQIRDACLIGGSSVVITDKVLLNDAVYYDKENRIDIRYGAVKYVLDRIALIEDRKILKQIDRGINLVGAASFNYYHLVVEILSRLAFVDRYEQFNDYPILVDEVVLRIPQYRSALECINKAGHPVITMEQDQKYLIRDLILPSSNVWMPINVYDRKQMRSSDFMISDTVLTDIRKAVGVWRDCSAWRKIFVSRKNTQTVRLKNEKEVRELFAQSGFEIVYTEEMTFREQIKCFGQAKCVVAATGAALTNIIFCQPGTVIGCIIPAQDRFCMYSTIGYILGLKSLFLDADIVELTPYPAADTFILNLDYVKRYINHIQEIL